MATALATEEGLEQFEQLEQKIERVLNSLQTLRSEKEELKEQNAQLRRRFAEHDREFRALQEQVNRFEKERESVKTRVQRIMEQVDTLAHAAADAD